MAFVVARLSSSRLPGKQFRLIGDRSLLQWIIDELRSCKELSEIVIATVAEKENEPLREFARDRDLPCFSYEGKVDHVTTRLRKAAERFNADICVLISGDCPLIYSPSIDHLIRQARQHPDADVIGIKEDDEGNPPAVEGIGIARIRAWQLADDLSDRPELKEHQFPIIDKRPDLFRTHLCRLPKDIYSPYRHRLSVDTWADLEFMNTIYHALSDINRPFSLPDALHLIKKKPELLEINGHVHQMAVGEERKRVLIIVDAGNGYGYGHVMRSRELALQITERLSWPVAFAVDDEKARHMLEGTGIRTLQWSLDSDATGSCLADIAAGFELTILDIYYQRSLAPGWRQGFPKNCKVVVLDRQGGWAREADLVVIPGVTYESFETQEAGTSRVVAGKQYIILRREIRKIQGMGIHKDLDLLAYLHSPDQKESVRSLTSKNGSKAHMVKAFGSDFPELLARSRVFLSGFGYSFYEALAVGTYPITLPLSEFHKTDAEKFYDRLSIPCGVLGSVEEVEKAVNEMVNQKAEFENLSIGDGTPRIVEEISSLFKNDQK